MTQAELGALVGSSESSIGRYEATGQIPLKRVRRKLIEHKIISQEDLERIIKSAAGDPLQESLLKSETQSSVSPDQRYTQLRPFRIERPDQYEFEQFLDLMNNVFDKEVRDPDEDLERWLRNSNSYQKEDPPCHDWFLVAKFDPSQQLDDDIAGLLYASNYPTLQYLFISYIAANEPLAETLSARKESGIASKILKHAVRILLRHLATKTLWERGVIAEVEKKIAEKNALLKRQFRYYASAYFERNLYQVGIQYLQPSLDMIKMHDLKELEEQDLLLMPGPELQERIDSNRNQLPREDVEDILRFVYMTIYAGNFDEKYRVYITDLFKKICRSLPEMVPVEKIR